MMTGDILTQLVGHTGLNTALSINVRHGMIYSGSSDANVRVWNSKECIPQITMNASDDPELNFL